MKRFISQSSKNSIAVRSSLYLSQKSLFISHKKFSFAKIPKILVREQLVSAIPEYQNIKSLFFTCIIIAENGHYVSFCFSSSQMQSECNETPFVFSSDRNGLNRGTGMTRPAAHVCSILGISALITL